MPDAPDAADPAPPADPASAGPAPPIDLARLRTLTEGDERLERELLAIYVAEAARFLARMRDATLAGEPSWSQAAHALKGASASVCATRVEALAAEAEEAGAPDRETLGRLAEALEAVWRHVGHPPPG